MLHQCVKLSCMGFQKFMNGYLGIHTDGLNLSKPLTDGG